LTSDKHCVANEAAAATRIQRVVRRTLSRQKQQRPRETAVPDDTTFFHWGLADVSMIAERGDSDSDDDVEKAVASEREEEIPQRRGWGIFATIAGHAVFNFLTSNAPIEEDDVIALAAIVKGSGAVGGGGGGGGTATAAAHQ
jgi:hypothetical protein